MITSHDEFETSLDQIAFDQANAPVALHQKLHRLVQVFKHYNILQMVRRAQRVGLQRIWKDKCIGNTQRYEAYLKESAVVEELAEYVVLQQRTHPIHSKTDLSSGTFILLNHAVAGREGKLDEAVLGEQTHLWRFQYHYQEFLLAAAAKGEWAEIEIFIHEWLLSYGSSNTKRSHDSWHPYCISRRVAVWVWLLVYSRKQVNALSGSLCKVMLASLIHQADYLSKNMEWELGGNHLLENVTALAIVGGVVDCEKESKFCDLALEVLSKELPKQILLHGEHYERTPTYHCQVLSNLLRMEICCNDQPFYKELLGSYVSGMSEFLNALRHPDGEIPMFGDSAFYESASVRQIYDVSLLAGYQLDGNERSLSTQQLGDYFILRSNSVFALFDSGSIAAPELPAHGHCDALNLEVSVEGKRWIVDSGNYNYEDDGMRAYCRSSIGHNVLTVDDKNQANVWSIFRMGDRPSLYGQSSGSTVGWDWACATHNGYKNVGIEEIKRLVGMQEDNLFCIDMPKISTKNRCSSFIGYVHLHPDVSIRKINKEKTRFILNLELGDTIRSISVLAETVSIEQGWYCEEFGRRERGLVIRYSVEVCEGAIGWCLQSESNQFEVRSSDEGLVVVVGDCSPLEWNRDECRIGKEEYGV